MAILRHITNSQQNRWTTPLRFPLLGNYPQNLFFAHNSQIYNGIRRDTRPLKLQPVADKRILYTRGDLG